MSTIKRKPLNFGVVIILPITTLNKVESSLHKHLNEHLNAEIIAGTISNSEQALDWVKSTYLYMRVNKNPSFYQLDDDPSIVNTDDQILKICKSALSSMHKIGLVLLSKNGSVGGTGIALGFFSGHIEGKLILWLPLS